jgi:hypothetical protein
MYWRRYPHPEITANRKASPAAAHPGGLLFALFGLLTRKRVHVLFYTNLLRYFIFLKLILYTFRYRIWSMSPFCL